MTLARSWGPHRLLILVDVGGAVWASRTYSLPHINNSAELRNLTIAVDFHLDQVNPEIASIFNKMKTSITHEVINWSPAQVCTWLSKLVDEEKQIDKDFIGSNRIDGRKLFLLSADDLAAMGVKKVGVQETILHAIDNLRDEIHGRNTNEALQNKIVNLACSSRMLYSHLVHKRAWETNKPECDGSFLSDDIRQDQVLLETLSFVSEVVDAVQKLVLIISRPPYKDNKELRSMRSLVLALGIELASTAQRDQFVEKPNEILERSSKVLADYCDRIVQNSNDIIFVEPLRETQPNSV